MKRKTVSRRRFKKRGQKDVYDAFDAVRAGIKAGEYVNKYTNNKPKTLSAPTKNKSKLRKKTKLHLQTNGTLRECTVNIYNKPPSGVKDRFKDGAYGTAESAAGIGMATGIAAGALNIQKVGDVGTFFDGTTILALVQNAWGASTEWGLLRPGIASTSTGGIVYLKKVNIQMEFTSMAAAPCFVDVYIVRAKQDNTIAPSPSAVWEASLDANSGINTAAGVTTAMPNSRPTGKYFKSFYEVVGETHILMNSGETRRHNINIHLNKTIDYERLSTNVNIRGITHQVFWVMRGTPADTFNAPGSTSVGTIMYAPSKLVGVLTYKYHTKCAVKPGRIVQQQNSLSAAGAGAALYTAADETGASVNVATALVG